MTRRNIEKLRQIQVQRLPNLHILTHLAQSPFKVLVVVLAGGGRTTRKSSPFSWTGNADTMRCVGAVGKERESGGCNTRGC